MAMIEQSNHRKSRSTLKPLNNSLGHSTKGSNASFINVQVMKQVPRNVKGSPPFLDYSGSYGTFKQPKKSYQIGKKRKIRKELHTNFQSQTSQS